MKNIVINKYFSFLLIVLFLLLCSYQKKEKKAIDGKRNKEIEKK